MSQSDSLELLGGVEAFLEEDYYRYARFDAAIGRELVSIEQFLRSRFEAAGPCEIDWSCQQFFKQGDYLIFLMPLCSDEIERARERWSTDLSIQALIELKRHYFSLEIVFNYGPDSPGGKLFYLCSNYVRQFSAAIVGTLSCEKMRRGA